VPAPAFSYQAGGQSKPFTVVTTSASFGPGDLVRQITGQLGPGPAASPAASPGPARRAAPVVAPGAGLSAAGFSRGAIQGCVTRVAAGGQVQLVELGRYQGRRAVIIVVTPASGGPARIWVVGSGCSSARSDVIAQMALPGAG
jgi:hypothetical protein